MNIVLYSVHLMPSISIVDKHIRIYIGREWSQFTLSMLVNINLYENSHHKYYVKNYCNSFLSPDRWLFDVKQA